MDGHLAKIFGHGNDAHKRISNYFREIGCLVEEEKVANWKNPSIHGRCDCIIRNDENGLFYVVEMKTINDSGFKKLATAKPEHEVQLQAYLNILGYDNGIVLYENKDNQKWKCFEIKKDYELWNNVILVRLNNIVKMAGEKNVPQIGKDHSRYCDCLSIS